MDLKDVSAVVTGGASGLGEATSRLLSERGVRVVVAVMVLVAWPLGRVANASHPPIANPTTKTATAAAIVAGRVFIVRARRPRVRACALLARTRIAGGLAPAWHVPAPRRCTSHGTPSRGDCALET